MSKSNCYFDGEVDLAHFPTEHYRYSMTNCLNEALFQKAEATFNCTPIMAPLAPKQRCTAKVSEVKPFPLGSIDKILSKGKEVTCKANCNDQPMSVSLHYTEKLKVPPISKALCIILKKINASCQKKGWKKYFIEKRYDGICEKIKVVGKKCGKGILINMQKEKPDIFEVLKNVVDQYAEENIAVVNVWLVDPYVKKIVRDVKVSTSQFIANVGGNLGLWQGMSLISVVELVYFFIKWLSVKIKPKDNLLMVAPMT